MLMGLNRSICWQDQCAAPWHLVCILDACITLKYEQVRFPVDVYSKISSPKNEIRFVGACICLASMMLNHMACASKIS